MTRPWHRDKDAYTSQELHATSDHQENRLGPFVTPETRNTLQSCQSDEESQPWQGHGAAHQASRCLQLWGQEQKGVVHLTLHPDVGLSVAVHPQAFPTSLHHNDVLSDESRHFPHRHPRGGCCTNQSDKANTHGGYLGNGSDHSDGGLFQVGRVQQRREDLPIWRNVTTVRNGLFWERIFVLTSLVQSHRGKEEFCLFCVYGSSGSISAIILLQ